MVEFRSSSKVAGKSLLYDMAMVKVVTFGRDVHVTQIEMSGTNRDVRFGYTPHPRHPVIVSSSTL